MAATKPLREPNQSAEGFDAALQRAWKEHGDHAVGVGQRLDALASAADTPQRLAAVGALAVHLHCEHFTDPGADAGVQYATGLAGGIAFLERLLAKPLAAQHPASAAALWRGRAVLAHLAEDPAAAEHEHRAAEADPGSSPASHFARIRAVAASGWVHRRRPRHALGLWREALLAASALDGGDDPVAMPIAINGNNIACELEDRAGRTAEETMLMLSAATAARRYWAIAGGRTEVGRAEYRLAMSYLAAGHPEQAASHARAALELASDATVPTADKAFAHLAIARCLRESARRGDVRSRYAARPPADPAIAAASAALAETIESERNAAAALVATLDVEQRRELEHELIEFSAER